MENRFWKICLIIAITIIGVLSRDSCVLIYEKDVPDKPDIILLTEGNNELQPAICRISSSELLSIKNLYIRPSPPTLPCHIVSRRQAIRYMPVSNRFCNGCKRPRWSSSRPLCSVRYSYNHQFRLARFRSLRYDAREQLILYFSSNHQVGVVKQYLWGLKPASENIHFRNPKSTDELTDFAYDWITKNVYINGRNRISVVNLNNPERITKIISNRLETTNLRVHPNKGYLYFIDAERRNIRNEKFLLNYAIYRADLDGSNIVRISEFINETMFELAIDYYTDRLYWSIPSSKIIQHSKLDGTDIRNFSCEYNSTIAFDKNYIYYIDGRTDSIVRYKKLENENDKDFRINSAKGSRISDFVINDVESQQILKNHPCLSNNGDCQQFCFAVPESDDKLKRVCKCKNKDKLKADLVSCTHDKNVTSNEFNNSTKPSN